MTPLSDVNGELFEHLCAQTTDRLGFDGVRPVAVLIRVVVRFDIDNVEEPEVVIDLRLAVGFEFPSERLWARQLALAREVDVLREPTTAGSNEERIASEQGPSLGTMCENSIQELGENVLLPDVLDRDTPRLGFIPQPCVQGSPVGTEVHWP